MLTINDAGRPYNLYRLEPCQIIDDIQHLAKTLGLFNRILLPSSIATRDYNINRINIHILSEGLIFHINLG
jgi:hypothetical protein